MAARAPRIETRDRQRSGRILVAAVLTLVVLGAQMLPSWATLDGRAFDALSTIAPPVPAEPAAVIVAVDEPSFSALGQQWPWPRDVHARLIAALRAAGAKAIAFDVVFADPSDADADAALGRAAGRDTIFAADETASENPQARTLIRTEPIPELLAAGATTGIASVALDGDGVLRRMPAYPDSFAAAIARAAGQAPAAPTPRPRLIQYLGPAGSYPRISYYQALDPAHFLPPGMLRGRTIIVGYSLQAAADLKAGATDAFETPYTPTTGQLMPGVEVQATILDNLLHGLSIATVPAGISIAVTVLAGIAAFALARAPHPALKAASVATTIVVTGLAAWLLLRFGRIWLSPIGPAAALAAVATGLTVRDYALERRLRRDVQGAFAQYLSPLMIERLVENPALLRLGGETREMTILFADIRGFTTISEVMKEDPEGLVRVINGILTAMSEVIIDHGGTIDKYIGDCVMAFWNAPLDDPDHACNAVKAGQGLVAALQPINAALQRDLPAGAAGLTIRIGVGINSGRCVVGNLGSDQRFDYSVLGDPVNVASRLESLSKDYALPVIIGESTAQAIGERLPLLHIDRIAVRGKREAHDVYTLLPAADGLPAVRDRQGAFRDALNRGSAEAAGAELAGRVPELAGYVARMIAAHRHVSGAPGS